MTMLWEIVFAVGFFALIMASIALHEIGHLVPAKIFGVKVTQYFVGFGKTLWSRTRGETEYGVKLVPLGGYVRLVGMYPPGKHPDQGGPAKAGPITRLADAAREAEWVSITPEDVQQRRLFYQKPSWQKLIVMFGGPAMNLLLAFLMFWGVTGLYGQYRSQLTIAAVQECVIPADRVERTCQSGDPATPAVASGIKAGDTVVAVNGQRVGSWDEVSALIRANRDGALTITVQRDGREVALAPVHTIVTGVPDKLDPTRRIEAGFFGVQPEVALVKGGPVTALRDMGRLTASSAVAISQFPVKVFNVARDMVLGRERDVNGPMSIVGASMTAGDIAVTDKLRPAEKAAVYVSLLASVNLFVALLNLVPLLPLDGGHMAGAIYEWLKRGLARAFRRPDPGFADTARMLPVAYAVGAFLLVSGLVLIVADVVSPIKIL